MRSIREILQYSSDNALPLAEAVLMMDSQATGTPAAQIREKIAARLADMRQSADEAGENEAGGKIISPEGHKLREYEKGGRAMSGAFLLHASATALDIAAYNAAMGRIVAAPTAGSCGILPGMLFAWARFSNLPPDDCSEKLTDALIVAAAIGEVIANRATLAGAEGGCQAECGAAAAMGAAALVCLQGGDGDAVASAVATTIKSILGLVCDPVGGLVEIPCVKRNGTLVSLGVIAADMALAGIKSAIPADEVIDAMAQVGRSLPPSLRETARGGLAITPTAKELVRRYCGPCERMEQRE